MVTIGWAMETDATAIAARGFFAPTTEFGTELASFMRDDKSSTP